MHCAQGSVYCMYLRTQCGTSYELHLSIHTAGIRTDMPDKTWIKNLPTCTLIKGNYITKCWIIEYFCVYIKVMMKALLNPLQLFSVKNFIEINDIYDVYIIIHIARQKHWKIFIFNRWIRTFIKWVNYVVIVFSRSKIICTF